MKRHILPLSLGLAAALGGLAPAHAQTSTPPGGQQLLQGARQALTKAGSVHIAMEEDLVSPHSGTAQLVLAADVGIRPTRLVERIYRRLAPPSAAATTSLRTITVVGNRAAAATGTAPAQCMRTSQLTAAVAPLVQALAIKVTGAQNMGATTFNGTPAWDVRVTESLAISQGGRPVQVDAYIEQATGRLLGVLSNFTAQVGTSTLHERVAVLYQRYGEPVQVTMPACR